jgi:hypothetical protein
MNLTTEDIKAEEFMTKCYELSDKIVNADKNITVTITECQLTFYSKSIAEVMQMFKAFLENATGPDEFQDIPYTWNVYANKCGDKYQLKFIQRFDLTTHS